MAIVAADKIFVDVNDEINFVVEKFLASESNQVILVCPQNAIIVSSQVSIKILVKQMLKSKKLLVIVTEDDFGSRIADAAGLVVTEKVSQISHNIWDQVAEMKKHLLAQVEERKQTLLQERGIIETEQNLVEQAEYELEMHVEEDGEVYLESVSEDDYEQEVIETAEIVVEEFVPEPQPEPQAEMQIEEMVIEPEQLEESAHEEQTMVESITPEQPLIGAIQRKRPAAKLVNMGNLTILGGGDISKFNQ